MSRFGSDFLKKRRKVLFILVITLLVVAGFFSYHHFVSYKIIKVNERMTLLKEDDFKLMQVVVMDYVPSDEYEIKEFEDSPWYLETSFLPLSWITTFAKIDYFFSLPYNKQKEEIEVRGLYTGDSSKLTGETVSIEVAGDLYETKGITSHVLRGETVWLELTAHGTNKQGTIIEIESDRSKANVNKDKEKSHWSLDTFISEEAEMPPLLPRYGESEWQLDRIDEIQNGDYRFEFISTKDQKSIITEYYTWDETKNEWVLSLKR